jgi:hypothetical protein
MDTTVQDLRVEKARLEKLVADAADAPAKIAEIEGLIVQVEAIFSELRPSDRRKRGYNNSKTMTPCPTCGDMYRTGTGVKNHHVRKHGQKLVTA